VGGVAIAGLLGEDFLSAFDLDLNLGTGTLTLYDVSGCSGHFLPWHDPYQAVTAWRPVRNILALPIRIGGTEVQAMLDTGALRSVVTLPGMVQLGLAAGGTDSVRGFGPASLAAHEQHFIAPIRTLRSIGALLGADWLARRHVWISWATDQVFIASP
jgi:hypothetical protein